MEKFKNLTKEKVDFIYKIIDILLRSVPFPIKEDVRTELLLHAMDICKLDSGYLFVSLKNRKASLLRSHLQKENVLIDSIELIDIPSKINCSQYALQILEDINVVYMAYIESTIKEKKYLQEVVKLYIKKGEINNTVISKKLKVNRKRGHHIITSIRKRIEEVKSGNRSKLLFNLRNVDDLYRAIRNTKAS